jgi:hypothetical protein
MLAGGRPGSGAKIQGTESGGPSQHREAAAAAAASAAACALKGVRTTKKQHLRDRWTPWVGQQLAQQALVGPPDLVSAATAVIDCSAEGKGCRLRLPATRLRSPSC